MNTTRPEALLPPPIAAWRWAVRLLFLPTLLSLAVWQLAQVSYLLFHTVSEFLAIMAGITSLLVATTSLQFTRNHFVAYIAIALGWCAGLDALHAIVYKGMNILPIDSANPGTQFWLAARGIQAVALVTAPFWLRRAVRVGWLHLGFGSLAILSTLLIYTGHFPAGYIDGVGLTPFKIYAEYVIMGLLVLALVQFWRHRAWMSNRLRVSLSMAVVAMLVAEFFFTQYSSVYDMANQMGHVAKIFAFWFVYAALVQSTLREPFAMLARAASSYDAVPDPTVIVSSRGIIRQANLAAARYLQQPAEQLAGQSVHTRFHNPGVAPQDCPVCRLLNAPGPGGTLEIALPEQQRTVECNLAPFTEDSGAQAWVQVVRDITERKRLAQERESLLFNLGERVKELRCIEAVSKLIQQPGLTETELLAQTVPLLPPGFLHPALAQAAIASEWGHFGATEPASDTAQRLDVQVLREGTAVATLRVWYPTSAWPDAHFLPEEATLLANVASLLGKMLERLLVTERHRRLNELYGLLSATNQAIVHSGDAETLLQTVFGALRRHGVFPMQYVALTDNGHWPLRLVQHHGIADDHMPLYQDLLSSADSPMVQHLERVMTGKVFVVDLSTLPATPYAHLQAKFGPWIQTLLDMGIRQRILLPLLQGDALLGVIGLYTQGHPVFDDAQLHLLQEITSDLGFALGNFKKEGLRHAAEQQAREMEQRFGEVFRFSPVPMQILSLDKHQLLAINQAHQRWLGYDLADIASEEAWFERVYPDPAVRSALHHHWQQALTLAQQGQEVHSPELTLTCRDGSHRTASGTMTVVGNDIIIAWTDLTDIRSNEQALRDSEQRFRSMVEQSVNGIYVRRDGRFIYVNPPFCAMTGYSAEELIGQEVLHFTVPDPTTHAEIRRHWHELHTGQFDHVNYTAPMLKRDGQAIEMSLHAKVIDWDDGLPADIVMAQDVTERKRTEEQIAAYVKQLEGAMQGTLQAVSNMVELRDPYTAGHERRVGLIASAIAHEMGWSPERCVQLEMLGLVHDIGKVAVPAEILTKPTRLSKVEMALIQGHAQAGYDILKDVPFPLPVAEIIRQHHERMDGSGYPQGLKGEEIMPEARILAVADVMESMASHRPYRPAVGLPAALAEVIQGRGHLYDPDVVDAMIRLVQDKGYQLPS